jgi:uncharacterized protein YecT (DUF1311 family)
MWEQVVWPGVTIVVGIIAGLAGYFGRRRIERHGDTEKLERTSRVLDIHERMQRANLTPEALRELEGDLLTQRAARLHKIEIDIKSEISTDISAMLSPSEPEESEPIATQAEMNESALETSKAARRNLDQTLASAMSNRDLPDTLKLRIKDSQRHWEMYAEAQAKVVADIYSTGSMQPMVYYTELDRLTIMRAAEIKDLVEFYEMLS